MIKRKQTSLSNTPPKIKPMICLIISKDSEFSSGDTLADSVSSFIRESKTLKTINNEIPFKPIVCLLHIQF